MYHCLLLPLDGNRNNNKRNNNNNNKIKTKNKNTKKYIEIIPVQLNKDVKPNDKLDLLILQSLQKARRILYDNDILVIAHKIVSKSESRLVKLDKIRPSARSLAIAKEHGKDPRVVELILNESNDILRISRGIIIVETRQGLICANAGIDQSNIEDGSNYAVLLPVDSDKSASKIRESLKKKTGKNVAIIISDTFGRPFREGQVNVAIGIAGIEPIKNYIGKADMYGRKLRVTQIAVADEIASAAELAMGKADGIPIVIIRGYNYQRAREKESISQLIRAKENDLFRQHSD
jgi:coenzyme F420-0:L-glutamate ligase/coenzyme F420-1:gamma-L-glutamate ligase